MHRNSIMAVFAVAILVSAAAAQPSAYSGYETRSIKALSVEEIGDLKAGNGAGFALAAELNHYPGPSHVLALSEKLRLSEEQRAAASEIFQRMREAAILAGRQMIAAEERLDRAFAEASVTEAGLAKLVDDAATLRGRLRGIHLAAHLGMRSALTAEQIQTYDRLRGYADAKGQKQHSPHDHK